MKILSFMMRGRFAHFCSPFTNVYRLTQPCPTKTSIMGFIGAVLGIYKDDLNLYQEIKCGVEISSPYRTITLPYLARKGFPGSSANKESSRTSVEVIVNPRYRIYISGNEKTLSNIRGLMLQQESIFTPCLGLAQFIASTDFRVSEIVEGELVVNRDIDVSGVLIRGYHGELDFKKIRNMSSKSKLRIAEFEGLKGIQYPRNFEHAVFTLNIDGGSVPIRDAENILEIPSWGKYVSIF